jgi:Na+/H+ antiporter NhaD/arsenite permease-like protein
MSALLTLDVAAVVAVPVGLAIARRHGREGRSHVAAALVGANVGSLVFPFSNLTNLVLVAGTGIGFGAFVAEAWLPQVAAALGAGVVLALRARSLERRGASDDERATSVERRHPTEVGDDEAGPLGPFGVASGALAVVGALGAVVLGFAEGDVASELTMVAATITALALVDGRLRLPSVARAVPVAPVLVLLAAAVLREPIASLAGYLPRPDVLVSPALALPLIALVGGTLAATVNNLPAAAFGGIWLAGAGGPAIVAYLIGTNILALVTPHGSVATMLGRSLAHRGGVEITPRDYLWRGWRYAIAGAVPALVVVVLAAGPR